LAPGGRSWQLILPHLKENTNQSSAVNEVHGLGTDEAAILDLSGRAAALVSRL
jgi:hypothetical protein